VGAAGLVGRDGGAVVDAVGDAVGGAFGACLESRLIVRKRDGDRFEVSSPG